MESVNIIKLKEAMATAEKYYEKKFEKKKNKISFIQKKRIIRALKNSYTVLSRRTYTQEEIDKLEREVWRSLEEDNILFYILYFLFGISLIFASYESYTFLSQNWDKVREIIIHPGNSDNLDDEDDSSDRDDSNNSNGSNISNGSSDSVDNSVRVDYIETNIVNLHDLLSVDDTVGLKNTAQEFSVSNTSSTMPDINYNINYSVNIKPINESNDNLIDINYIKYKYIKIDDRGNKYESEIGRLSELEKNNDGSFKFILGKQGKDSKDSYKVIFWIASDAGNDQQGKNYTLAFQTIAVVELK